MKKNILNFLIFIITLLITNNVFAGGNDHIKNIETKIPEYVGKLAGTYINDIEYRKKGVLSLDRDYNTYIVIPSNGLVTPVHNLTYNGIDFTKLLNFKYVDVNKYLKYGTLIYPTKEKLNYGEKGNITIMGHSSYLKKDDGRYKTHFQLIIGLEEGKEIWIFKKENDQFKRYKYKINKSYNTTPEDVGILKNNNKKELTLFTCTPIGGIGGRWIIKSEYIEENDFSKINNKIKLAVEIKIINKIRKKESKLKRIQYINKLIIKLNKITTKKEDLKLIINYIVSELEKLKKEA